VSAYHAKAKGMDRRNKSLNFFILSSGSGKKRFLAEDTINGVISVVFC